MTTIAPLGEQPIPAPKPKIESPRMPRIAQSRARLLAEIGPAPDVTFIRTTGNVGDQLIWAGTRNLLRDHVYREISVDDVAFASGELALISGGGAWTRRYVDYLPELLAIAELRFERVIVLPSSFEVAEDRVREALSATSAKVFARELESYRQISGICDADLAHDCAFFADLSRYARIEGAGELNVFRVDDESSGMIDPPTGNSDISESAVSIDDWLATIAAHRTINTDRAHVMIAGALLGKRVQYLPCSYFKVDAIAESCLTDLDVSRHPQWRELPTADTPNLRARPDLRIDVVIVGRDDGPSAFDSAESAARDGTANVLVHDRNSRPSTRTFLVEKIADLPNISCRYADRDGGLAATVRLHSEESDAEYLMVLEAGSMLDPGALEAMVSALEDEPTAAAVAPLLIDPSGSVQHCGGWLAQGSQTLELRLDLRDESCEDVPAGVESTGCVPPMGSLFRRSVFERTPLAEIDDVQTMGVEWALRAAANGDTLLASRDAVVRADWKAEAPTGKSFTARREAALQLPALSDLYARTDLVLTDRLALLVPELQSESGEIDLDAARLLLSAVAEHGAAWVLMEWVNGGLAPLLGLADDHPAIVDAAAAAEQRRDYVNWLEQRNEMLSGIENGGWWKLRERVQPILKLARRGGER